MPTEIKTGGLKKFVYSKNKPKRDLELEADIEKGYDQAAQRKRRQKLIKWIIIGLIIILILGWVLLR